MWTHLWSKLRAIGRDRDGRFDRDLTEEIDFHRAMLERDSARSGLDAETAETAARRRIGNTAIVHEDARRAWAFGWLEDAARDLRLAVRGYRRSPGFTLAAILVLALGLGANMAIFRFVDAALFETLPIARPQELVLVGPRAYSYPAFQEIAEGTGDVLASAAAWFSTRSNLTVDGRAEYLPIELVSGRYFDTLGVRPALGRLLVVEDDGAEGAHPVCTISYGLWQRMFAGAPDIVGKLVRLNNEPFEIVGVTARGFQGAELHKQSDVQVPLSMAHAVGGYTRDTRSMTWLRIIGRLAPGVSRDQADGVVRARYESLESPGLSGATDSPLAVTDGRQGFAATRANLIDAVIIAQMLSACVLVIACASLAGLLLARVSARRHEMAMRLALGASRRRLVAQLLIETTGLAAAGALVATWLAIVLGGVLTGMLAGPESTFQIAAVPSARGLAGAMLVTIFTAIGVGLLPALSATRKLPLHTLRESGRTSSGTSRLTDPLIVAQIAGCLALIFGAGLLGRTLYNLRATDLGLDPERVVVVTANPGQAGYQRERQTEFYADWLSRAQRIPGVISASLAATTAMTQTRFLFTIEVPGVEPSSGPEPLPYVNAVSPDYFKTVGLPVIAGRAFTEADTAQSPQVAIVNEQFVKRYWPGQSPIGRQFSRGSVTMTIVGLVSTAKAQTVREDPQIEFYRPLSQMTTFGAATVHARVDGDKDIVGAALARAAREIDPAMPISSVTTMTELVDARLANERVLNVLGLLFGALALLVAAAGLYGTVAYAVARRTREIGIRSAIGAQRLDIVRLFAGRTLVLVAAGIVIGTPAALMAGRALGSVLYGVDPTSPSTLVAAVVLLAAVAVTAAVVPALKGARVDPVRALKSE